jgi:TatD DNase family protein
VAWGEIGLDFYRRYSPPQVQVAAFKRQLEMATDLDLPVIIHDREAHTELLEILEEMPRRKAGGVIHCFSGDYDMAMALIEMGYHISIPGTVTYKKAIQVHEVATRIPLERMLVETDAPFLAPVPFRGKRNEPLFVTYTARKIAELRNMDFQEVALQTSENAKRVFGLPFLAP